MKPLVALVVLAVALPALALNEVECSGRNSDGERIDFLIEQGYGDNLRDAHYLVYQDDGTDDTVYRVATMRGQAGRVIYTGTEGVRLEIELSPDRQPRWGIRYRGQLSVAYSRVGALSCRFAQMRL